MKKTYIIPEALTVRLNTSNIIASSPNNFTFSDNTGSTNFINADLGQDDVVLTKENNNLWDNEW